MNSFRTGWSRRNKTTAQWLWPTCRRIRGRPTIRRRPGGKRPAVKADRFALMPSGKIIYGDCKGEFGRCNTETGQEQHYWIYPQQRYGKLPQEQRYRFVRQAPIEISPLNPNIVYHGSRARA